MNRPDRRKILQFIALGAVAPAIFSRPVRAQQVAGGLIAPPAGAMRFVREITRSAHDNAQITVTREFAVTFSKFADGFLVEGHQVSVNVEAPAGLAAFVQLERERVETGMFPVVLDPFGHIRQEELPTARASEVEQAFALAMRLIAAQPVAAGESDDIGQFVSALHQTGNIVAANMPVDLFAPERSARTEDRDFRLPTGDVGRLVSRFDAERDQQTGLMRRATREILTQIEGDQRRTVEQWRLVAE